MGQTASGQAAISRTFTKLKGKPSIVIFGLSPDHNWKHTFYSTTQSTFPCKSSFWWPIVVIIHTVSSIYKSIPQPPNNLNVDNTTINKPSPSHHQSQFLNMLWFSKYPPNQFKSPLVVKKHHFSWLKHNFWWLNHHFLCIGGIKNGNV